MARTRPAGKSTRISTLASPDQRRRSDALAHRRARREQRLPPLLQRRDQVALRLRLPPRVQVAQPALPVGPVLREVLALAFEDRRDVRLRDRVRHRDRVGVPRRSRCREWPAGPGGRTLRGGRGTCAGRRRCSEPGVRGFISRRSTMLRWNSASSRKHGGPALGTIALALIDSTYRIALVSWLSTLASTR